MVERCAARRRWCRCRCQRCSAEGVPRQAGAGCYLAVVVPGQNLVRPKCGAGVVGSSDVLQSELEVTNLSVSHSRCYPRCCRCRCQCVVAADCVLVVVLMVRQGSIWIQLEVELTRIAAGCARRFEVHPRARGLGAAKLLQATMNRQVSFSTMTWYCRTSQPELETRLRAGQTKLVRAPCSAACGAAGTFPSRWEAT